MGRHQRAETGGLISFILCACVGAIGMNLYLRYAPAIWQVSQRRFTVCAGIVAACAVVSFCVGYISNSRSMTLKNGWLAPIRRIIETLALSTVYAATTFLSSFALLGAINEMMGTLFVGYMSSVCAAFAGVVGYMTFVQAEMMSAKTLASLLPFFVIAGVSVAGLTTDDPYWYHNNFSQLGDRTTFAATMFNSTLMLAGVCIIIVSYFAVSELLTTERLMRLWHDHTRDDPNRGYDIPHFVTRMTVLAVLLTLSGLAFIGIGAFRYTPHNLMHNICAKGLPFIMLLLFLLLPWLAPRIGKAVMVVSDLVALVCAGFWANMMLGHNTLTNVEALAGLLFLGWFIVFSRQIAAIEADRVTMQLVRHQAQLQLEDNGEGQSDDNAQIDSDVDASTGTGSQTVPMSITANVTAGTSIHADAHKPSTAMPESRIASDR
ncbi:ABC transporter permease [Bifidobacterium callitrichos]|uniref:ABC transporter permease n=1 Tax=Bifidobacterium callitrichos DSM 23973 TaxID=1437609 RepID=A0A087ACM2_9BIFI|nr:ABC transporter permease [Bifidobacterium callitrichos]KFI56522.1 ABC transporter permease [Bifidobacterium callitrichos DSM 23973]